MKTARRLLSVLLALLMVFSLVACAGGGEEPVSKVEGNSNQQTNTQDSGSVGGEEDVFVLPDRPVDEMNGKKYIIIQHDEVANPFGYSQDSKMGELVANRVGEVQELYGCTLEYYMLAYNTDFPSALQAMSFAENSGDLVFSYNNAMLRRTLGTGGDSSLMVDLLTVDHIIDFWNAEKWGNITARETMMAGGTFYGVTPALWIDCTPLPYYTMVYNKDLTEAFGVVDPQETWEKGEWDRQAMLEAITACYDDTAADVVYGISAGREHMVNATFYATGLNSWSIDKINSDGTVDYTNGWSSPDAVEALTWLRNAWKGYTKYFNGGDLEFNTWDSYVPFVENKSAFCLTRPKTFFSDIVGADSVSNFGIITWAGSEPNLQVGYYENCYSVAIPRFAQDAEQSAFLMYDLFEGIGDIETYDDVLEYYRETYFNTDTDMVCFVRPEGKFEYSYWPNDTRKAYVQIQSELYTASSVSALIGKYANLDNEAIETYIIPNKVQLEAYRQNGYFS